MSQFAAGNIVAHHSFGIGSINEVSINADESEIVVVNFVNHGIKKLMVRFARLVLCEDLNTDLSTIIFPTPEINSFQNIIGKSEPFIHSRPFADGVYNSNRHKEAKLNGKLTAGEVAKILNKQFKPEVKINAKELKPYATEWHHSGFYKGYNGSRMGRTYFFDPETNFSELYKKIR